MVMFGTQVKGHPLLTGGHKVTYLTCSLELEPHAELNLSLRA